MNGFLSVSAIDDPRAAHRCNTTRARFTDQALLKSVSDPVPLLEFRGFGCLHFGLQIMPLVTLAQSFEGFYKASKTQS